MKRFFALMSALVMCLSLIGAAPVLHAHAEEVCAHENTTIYFINDDNQYHALTCKDCGAVLGEKEAHVFGGYGYWDDKTHSAYCDVCFAVYGEKEPCVVGDEYVANVGEGTHSLGCSICDGPVGEAVACTPGDEHIQYLDEVGYHRVVCSVCGGESEKEVCTPGDEYVSAWEEDDTSSGHYVVCAVCSLPMGEVLPHTMGWFRFNGILCAYGCAACDYTEKEEEHDWDPASCKDTGDGIWHSIICKRCGGEGAETHWLEEGKATYTSTGDLYTHAYSGPCAMCGATKTGESYHTANSCDAKACADCGQEGALVFRDYIEHEVGEWYYEDGKHYQICENCGQKVNVGPCEYYCDDDGCWTCEQKNPDVEMHWSEKYVVKEDGHYWVCEACGNERFIDGHALSCNEETGSWCWTCEEEYPDLKPAHSYATMCDETGHWEECLICGDKKAVENHVADCLVYGYCAVCWEELPADTEYKHFEIVWMNTGKQHWSMCSWCGEIMAKVADHTPSAADETICSVCGGKIDLEDTHEHGWKTREIPATCVKDGFLVDNCPTCGIEMGRVRVKATGHQYGEFADNGDGTQTAACTVCGETITETIEAAAEEPAAEEPAPAIEPAVEGEEAVPVNAYLKVEEAQEVAVSEDVLNSISGTVEKAFEVILIVKDEEVQPSGEVKVKIPLTEEEAAAMEGKVIMLIGEDGVPVEVAFEIVEGELIIRTEKLGLFIIVAKAE